MIGLFRFRFRALTIIFAALFAPLPAFADYLAAETALQAKDYAQAIPLLVEEANLGNPIAAYNLGKLLSTGELGGVDYAKAAGWFRQAANPGSVPARFDGQQLGPQAADLIFAAQLYSQFELAKLYEEGKGLPADINEALRWYSRAAAQDFDLAELALVRLYRDGHGSELLPDAAKATTWLTRLAEQGNVGAMNDLGKAYLQGQGVPKNVKLAQSLFEKAAVLGSAAAPFNLGILFQTGALGNPDYPRALKNFQLSANREDPHAMAALGDLYSSETNIPQDNVQALMWYELAVRHGLQSAQARRDQLAATMKPFDVSNAEAMASQWQPQSDLAGIPVESMPSLSTTNSKPIAPASEPMAEPAGVEPYPSTQTQAPASSAPLATAPATDSTAPTDLGANIPTTLPSETAIPSSSESSPAKTAPAAANPVDITTLQPPPPPQPAPVAPAPVTLIGQPQPGSKPFEPLSDDMLTTP